VNSRYPPGLTQDGERVKRRRLPLAASPPFAATSSRSGRETHFRAVLGGEDAVEYLFCGLLAVARRGRERHPVRHGTRLGWQKVLRFFAGSPPLAVIKSRAAKPHRRSSARHDTDRPAVTRNAFRNRNPPTQREPYARVSRPWHRSEFVHRTSGCKRRLGGVVWFGHGCCSPLLILHVLMSIWRATRERCCTLARLHRQNDP
jgi:hypothetical protein